MLCKTRVSVPFLALLEQGGKARESRVQDQVNQSMDSGTCSPAEPVQTRHQTTEQNEKEKGKVEGEGEPVERVFEFLFFMSIGLYFIYFSYFKAIFTTHPL